mmetsp:Transcript_19708/g.53160  ORF Transcript_19708/g.53160 Transcript_19708/m.53160 type:complete len:406 (-) Transcript_19708:619-1836(-)
MGQAASMPCASWCRTSDTSAANKLLDRERLASSAAATGTCDVAVMSPERISGQGLSTDGSLQDSAHGTEDAPGAAFEDAVDDLATNDEALASAGAECDDIVSVEPPANTAPATDEDLELEDAAGKHTEDDGQRPQGEETEAAALAEDVPALDLSTFEHPTSFVPAPPAVTPSPRPANFSWDGYEWKDLCTPVLTWVSAATGAQLPDGGAEHMDEVAAHAYLCSGEVLCALANRIRPGCVRVVEREATPFAQRTNIGNFLLAARDLGVGDHELFQTHDLFELADIKQVCICLASLGRLCHDLAGYKGPRFGKPVRAKLGAHKSSKFSVVTNQGLWGKAAGAYRPSAGAQLLHLRPASATGYLPPPPKVKAPVKGQTLSAWNLNDLAALAISPRATSSSSGATARRR